MTDTGIRKATLADKPSWLPDIKGQFLFVTRAGGKLWRFMYRLDWKRKIMALEDGHNVPFVVARELHLEAPVLLVTGIDPMAHRKTEISTENANAQNAFCSLAALVALSLCIASLQR